jgi:hypothetical protein
MARIDFPFDEFFFLLRYVTNCCPNIQSLVAHFLLQGEFSDEDFKILSGWLETTIIGFAEGQLSKMEFNCDLIIAFRAFFPESTLMVFLIKLIKSNLIHFRRQQRPTTFWQILERREFSMEMQLGTM